VAVIRAYQATIAGRLDAARALTDQASQWLAPEDTFFQGIVSWLNGMSQYFSHGTASASRAFSETVRLSQKSGSLLMALLSIFADGYIHVMQGHLCMSYERFQDGLRLVTAEPQRPLLDQNGPLPIGTSLIYQGLGEIARERNDLAQAEQYLSKCVALAERWGNAEPLADGYVVYARIKHALGDVPNAFQLVAQAEKLGHEGQLTPLTVSQMQIHRARLCIAEGRLDEAAQLVTTKSFFPDDQAQAADEPFSLYVGALHERTLAWLYIAQGRHKQALGLLPPLLKRLHAAGWNGVVIKVLALLALAWEGEGQTARAVKILHRALSLAEPEGYVRTFVDLGTPMADLLTKSRLSIDDKLRPYVGRLLSAFHDWPRSRSQARRLTAPESPLVEPLTAREREVLRLVVSGRSNREIAEELVITLGTAKRHVSNIYAKLDVHSRVHAVAKARELGLV